MRNFLILISTLLSFLISIAPISYAQENVGYGLVINRIKEEYVVSKGQQINDSFDIIHDFQEPGYSFTVYPVAEDVEMEPETGAPIFKKKEENKQIETLEDWVTFEESSYFLEKRSDKKTVKFSINVPTYAESGSYYGALVLSETDPKLLNDNNQVAIQGRISMLIVLTVKGDNVFSDLEIQSVVVRDIFGNTGFFGIFFHNPLFIETKIKNTGNIYTIPGGDIFIYGNDITKAYYSSQLNPNQNGILNNQTRVFTNEWGNTFFRLDKSTENDNIYAQFYPENINKFYLGNTNATVKLFFQNRVTGELKVDEFTVSFFLLPYPIILFVILIIFLILIGNYIFKTKLKKDVRRIKSISYK